MSTVATHENYRATHAKYLETRKTVFANGLVLYGVHVVGPKTSIRICRICWECNTYFHHMRKFYAGYVNPRFGPLADYDVYKTAFCFKCAGEIYENQSLDDWRSERKFDKFLNNRLRRVIAEAMSILNSKTTLGIQALVKICIGYMELPPVYWNYDPMYREDPPKYLVDETENVVIGPKSRVAHKSLTIVLPPELAELCLEYLAGEPGFSFPLQL